MSEYGGDTARSYASSASYASSSGGGKGGGGLLERQLKSHFASVDTDGGGTLDRDEVRAVFVRLKLEVRALDDLLRIALILTRA